MEMDQKIAEYLILTKLNSTYNAYQQHLKDTKNLDAFLQFIIGFEIIFNLFLIIDDKTKDVILKLYKDKIEEMGTLFKAINCQYSSVIIRMFGYGGSKD